jgi:vacuolar protein sorting-associated protein 13D
MQFFNITGEVELENVPLRRDALRFIDTSLDVKNGLVGRVKLKIPSNLR